MKVYESSHPTKRDYTKVPQTCLAVRQVKIKNSQLRYSGFEPGREFVVIYQPGKITLVLVAKSENNN